MDLTQLANLGEFIGGVAVLVTLVTVHTDGLRAVLEFSDETVSLAEIDFFDWERLADHHRRQVSDDRVP